MPRPGQEHEARARRYLEDRGLTMIAKNYTCSHGEIDLIMQERAVLVFVEVRYRRSAAFGGALGSLDRAKQNRLIRAAQHYASGRSYTGAMRFDLIAYDGGNTRPIWVRNAFTAHDAAVFL